MAVIFSCCSYDPESEAFIKEEHDYLLGHGSHVVLSDLRLRYLEHIKRKIQKGEPVGPSHQPVDLKQEVSFGNEVRDRQVSRSFCVVLFLFKKEKRIFTATTPPSSLPCQAHRDERFEVVSEEGEHACFAGFASAVAPGGRCGSFQRVYTAEETFFNPMFGANSVYDLVYTDSLFNIWKVCPLLCVTFSFCGTDSVTLAACGSAATAFFSSCSSPVSFSPSFPYSHICTHTHTPLHVAGTALERDLSTRSEGRGGCGNLGQLQRRGAVPPESARRLLREHRRLLVATKLVAGEYVRVPGAHALPPHVQQSHQHFRPGLRPGDPLSLSVLFFERECVCLCVHRRA